MDITSASLPSSALVRASPHLSYVGVRLQKRGLLFSAEFRPALRGLVLPSSSDARAFMECTLGIAFPARGKVLWGDREPSGSPDLRVRLGGLLPAEPELAFPGTVQEYVEVIAALRGAHQVAMSRDFLQGAFCSELRERSANSLSETERRKLALGLALALTEPAALVLYEPLNDLTKTEAERVLHALKSQAERGVLVLSVSSTLAGVDRTSSHLHYLEQGSERPQASIHFLVRTDKPDETAQVLAEHDCVINTRVDQRHGSDLYVEAIGEDAGAAALMEALYTSGGSVLEVRRVAPPRPEESLP